MNTKVKTLWDQIKDLDGPLGPRLAPEPEALIEVQGWSTRLLGYAVSPRQTQAILESVPHIFPEDWKDCGSIDKLSEPQKQRAAEIMKMAPEYFMNGETFAMIIERGVQYRDQYGKKKRTKVA